MSDAQRLETSLENLASKLTRATIPKYDWRYEFRASNVPACQWRTCLSKAYENLPEEKPPDTTSFLFDFYTSVGTTIHSVVQRWLGRLGYLYGDYKCLGCSAVVKGHLGWPAACPTADCKNLNWDYIELKLHDVVPEAGIISAHCDGLIQFPWMKQDEFYLMDIKSCSTKNMPTKLDGDFTMKYLSQTAIYVHLLTVLGFKLKGTLFLMVARDNPLASKFISYNQTKMSTRIFENLVAENKEALAAADSGDLESLAKACDSQHDQPDCPFNDVCFSPRTGAKTLNSLFLKRNGRLPILPEEYTVVPPST